MMTTSSRFALCVASCVIIAGAALATRAVAAELPKATKAILDELKLDPARLAGLEQELRVPADWIDKARAEGALTIISSWDPRQFRKLSEPFRERYPFIKFNYSRASYNARVVKTLIAFKEGRHVTDMLSGFGGGYFLFRDANALEDLTDIPMFHKLPKDMRDPAGMWMGQRLRYWCMAYNTDKVTDKSQLPKRWEDLLTNSFWHGDKLAIANRPQLWLLMLWGTNGPKWTIDFANQFVNKVKPQLRKEGTNALISLVVAGEFHASVPSAAYRTSQYTAKGAPVAWHCPEPVPLAVSEMGIVKGAPHVHAAKLFANWFLTKEGQIAQFAANNAPPVHPELQTKEFLVFPDEILGKQIAYRSPELEKEYEKLVAVWDPIWKKATGEDDRKVETFQAKLEAVKRGGRVIEFARGGKKGKLRISGRRTRVTIDGALEARKNLKPGMACTITAPEGGREAQTVSCKN